MCKLENYGRYEIRMEKSGVKFVKVAHFSFDPT